ncbi:MAG TPA: phosphatase PAP2 family protein [Gemmatimonadales bacterium]|nr:phosphatase PAP2 family protein [Gemmatimonadales bacterium]
MPYAAIRCCRARALTVVLAAGCGAAAPASLAAQSLVPLTPAGGERAPGEVQWWHGALFVGGVSTLMLLDNAVRHGAQDIRGTDGNRLASTFRRFGQPEVYATATLGLLAAGMVSGDTEVTGAGRRLASSLALTAGMIYAGKSVMGRARPDDPVYDGDDFGLFSGRGSFPSGHTAMAFALATSLSDDIDRPWATVGLYTAAGAVGWSRIHDNRHWLSDVAAGAVLGIASAKFASGRWTIFGLRAPSVISGPRGPGVGWQAHF